MEIFYEPQTGSLYPTYSLYNRGNDVLSDTPTDHVKDVLPQLNDEEPYSILDLDTLEKHTEEAMKFEPIFENENNNENQTSNQKFSLHRPLPPISTILHVCKARSFVFPTKEFLNYQLVGGYYHPDDEIQSYFAEPNRMNEVPKVMADQRVTSPLISDSVPSTSLRSAEQPQSPSSSSSSNVSSFNSKPPSDDEKFFTTKSSVRKRSIGPQGPLNYVCECGKKFRDACYLKQHVTAVHQVRPHKCPKCGKRFADVQLLNEHIARHEGKKTFQCPYCPKSYVYSTDFTRHLYAHTGNTPHRCEICNIPFSRKDHLINHLKTRKHISRSNGGGAAGREWKRVISR